MNVRQLEEFVSNRIQEIKDEAHRRITAEYPMYQQLNALADATRIQNKEIVAIKNGKTYSPTTAEKTSLRKAGDMDNIITKIRKKSDKIERLFLNLDREQMLNFDPREDKHWRGEKHGGVCTNAKGK